MIACTESWNIGSITSTLKQNAEDDKFGGIGDTNATRDPDDVDNPYTVDFLRPYSDYPPPLLRGGIGAPVKVKGARGATGLGGYIQRTVATLRTPRQTTTLTSTRRFWKSPGPPGARLALDKPTNGADDHSSRPVTTIGRSPQVITTPNPAQPPPPKLPRDHPSWLRFWANVRRLLRLRRHGKIR